MESLTGNTSLTYGGTSAATTLLGGTILDTYSSGITTSNSFSLSNSTPQNTIMQNKVAVFHVVRDEDNKISKTEFIKELWVETKKNQSVDLQVARDKDLAEYRTDELDIKVISTITF